MNNKIASLEILPEAWSEFLRPFIDIDNFEGVLRKVELARKTQRIFPHQENIFESLRLTPPAEIKAVILGQDPYHGFGQAHGLAFSVCKGTKVPPSLRNIFQELRSDMKVPEPASGDLSHWARRGVLLLNNVLTVTEGKAHSHVGWGWEEFTDSVIKAVDANAAPSVFILWGKPAQSKIPLIDTNRHRLLQSVHPSPLSAHRGFFGSRPFSKTNALLKELGRQEIDWSLPAVDFGLGIC